ncbi:hypothetical protein GCM10011402_38310 [Paracoccus acridae]|uniref:Uncharacterized protein n=1 Tax=Paracoccus acridae TaxID=1795310 RepID=A0ABQ1VMQ5_9RHOB|nr:hypothetical protein GCM10011402_38310 [Paracoccus acridae]
MWQRQKQEPVQDFLVKRPLKKKPKPIDKIKNVTSCRLIKHFKRMIREGMKIGTQTGHQIFQSRYTQTY